MSPNRFPLVAFGGPERPARVRLIEGPDHGELDDELLTEVDAITKARKLKEQREAWEREICSGNAIYADRRCLVGMRRLEEGDGHGDRLKRLLDGPTDGRFPLPWPGNVQPVEAVNNESVVIGLPGIGADPSVPAIGGSAENGWAEVVRRNFLEVVAFTFIFGIVSVWIGIKRLRLPKSLYQSSVQLDDKPKPPAVYQPEVVKVSTIAETDSPLKPNSASPPELVTQPVPSSPQRDRSSPLVPDKPESKITLNGSAESAYTAAGDESDKEGDVNEDNPVILGKRKNRRGKRGKKKKVGIVLPESDEREEGKVLPVNGSTDPAEKALEPPPMSSIVINSPKPPPSAPSLVVSDSILGMNVSAVRWCLINSSPFVGFGSHGTVVFKGSLQGRAVAVKRLLQDFVTLASREVSILQQSDDHPNVIRYYYQEAHANFLYIALELCPASLADIIENPDREQWRDISIVFEPKKALKEITSGLRHLHALKLVHRDIKPQNILVSGAKPGPGGKTMYRMLISDFGLCKKLDVDQTSFLPTAHGSMAAGTVGWRAPEILRDEVKLDDLSDDHSMSSRGSTGTATGTSGTSRTTRLTKSVDIFALGCLFYYVLTNGSHPFGDRFEREVSILKNEKNLDGLERFGEEGAEAVNLITQMLDPVAQARCAKFI